MSTRLRFLVGFLAAAGVVVIAVAQPTAGPEASERRAAALRESVKTVDQNTAETRQRLAALQAELDKLDQRIKALPPPKDQTPAAVDTPIGPPLSGPTAAGPRDEKKDNEDKQANFRLPLVRLSELEAGILIVCRDKTVYYPDLKAIQEATEKVTDRDFEDAVRRARASRDWVPLKGGLLVAGKGDFDLKVDMKLSPDGTGVYIRKQLALKPKRTGEALDQLRSPKSEFETRMAAFRPDKHNVQFAVYPESYDLFREVRAIVWERGFTDVAWTPFAVGASIFLGGGAVRVN